MTINNGNHSLDHQKLFDEIKASLDKLDFLSAFEQLDKINWENDFSLYNKLKFDYIGGKSGHILANKLKVFVNTRKALVFQSIPKISSNGALLKIVFPLIDRPTITVGIFITPVRILTYFEEPHKLKIKDKVSVYLENQKIEGQISKINKSFVLISVTKYDFAAQNILPRGEPETPTTNQKYEIFYLPVDGNILTKVLQVELVARNGDEAEFRILAQEDINKEGIIGAPLVAVNQGIAGMIYKLKDDRVSAKLIRTINRAIDFHLLPENGLDDIEKLEESLTGYLRDILIKNKDEKHYSEKVNEISKQLKIVAKNQKIDVLFEEKNYPFNVFINSLILVLNKIDPDEENFVKQHNHFLEVLLQWVYEQNEESYLEKYSYIIFLYITICYLDHKKAANELNDTVFTLNAGVVSMLENVPYKKNVNSNVSILLPKKFDSKNAAFTLNKLNELEEIKELEFDPSLFAFIFVLGEFSLSYLSKSHKELLEKCMIFFKIDDDEDAETCFNQRFKLAELCEAYERHKEDGLLLNWSYSGKFFFHVLATLLMCETKKNRVEDAYKMALRA